MSPETFRWIVAAHVIGFTIWIGTVIGTMHLLRGHVDTDDVGRSSLQPVEKRMGLAMDIGALLAIATGLLLLLTKFGRLHLSAGSYMYLKLGAVALLVGLHGLVRVKIKRYRTREVTPLPGWVVPAQYVLALAVIVFIVVRPFAKH